MSDGMFTEEVINSWSKEGRIRTDCGADEARARILNAMSNTVRFNGMCRLRWSVLDHSWLVGLVASDLAHVACLGERSELESRLCGMLHDVGEAMVGDVIWPLKNGVFKSGYDQLYLPLEEAFREWSAEFAFGVSGYAEMRKRTLEQVSHADRLCGELEMVGVSTAGDFITGRYADPMFREIADTVCADGFAMEMRILNDGIAKLPSDDGGSECR